MLILIRFQAWHMALFRHVVEDITQTLLTHDLFFSDLSHCPAAHWFEHGGYSRGLWFNSAPYLALYLSVFEIIPVLSII